MSAWVVSDEFTWGETGACPPWELTARVVLSKSYPTEDNCWKFLLKDQYETSTIYFCCKFANRR